MKKKIGLIVFGVVVVVIVGLICYLNRTVSGDYLSDYLIENGVEKITFSKLAFGVDPGPEQELSKENVDEFLLLLKESKFKILRGNSHTTTDWDGFEINCSAKGRHLATIQSEGDDLVMVFSRDLSSKSIAYRVQTKDWRERLKAIA